MTETAPWKKSYGKLLQNVVALHSQTHSHRLIKEKFETLQERRINFSEFYCEYGYNIIEKLKKNINPLNMSFSVIVID